LIKRADPITNNTNFDGVNATRNGHSEFENQRNATDKSNGVYSEELERGA
jgi:hypothetical protein